MKTTFTSESVTEGHPDKMADQISDAILDAMLKDDSNSHVAVETLITTGQVHVAGEVRTATYVDISGIVRDKILDIGYDSSRKGFDGDSCGVSVSSVDGSRLRAVIPVASSSDRARSAHNGVLRPSNVASASRSGARASVRRCARRRNSP